MRAVTWLAAGGLVAAGAFAIYELRATSAPLPKVVASAPAPEPEAAPVKAPPPTVDVRPQIRRAAEAAAPALRSARDVERYLGELEQQARRNHRVTALEVEPGLIAIREHAGDDPQRQLELEGDFMRKMNRLSAELATP